MQEIHKNILDCTDGWIVIPTNGDTKEVGGKTVAVMGKGLAMQAAKKYGELPLMLGKMLKRNGFGVCFFNHGIANIVCLPTKHHWQDKHADLDLIRYSCEQLKFLSYYVYPQKFYLPRLGCGKGTGNLDWEKDVKPVMDAVLYNDERFILVSWT